MWLSGAQAALAHQLDGARAQPHAWAVRPCLALLRLDAQVRGREGHWWCLLATCRRM